MENPTTIAVDLSKNVFEIAVERQGRICQRKRLNRRQLVEFFSQSPRARGPDEDQDRQAEHGARPPEGIRGDDRRRSRESPAGRP